MLRARLDLLVVGASPSGNFAVFVQLELDCLNDPTAQPIPSGSVQMAPRTSLDKTLD